MSGEYGEGHTLNVVGGTELRGNDSHTLFNKRFNYDPRTGNTALPPIEKPSRARCGRSERLTGEYFTKSRYASFYLSADYSFRDRYILSVTGAPTAAPISARMRSSIRTGVWAEPGF